MLASHCPRNHVGLGLPYFILMGIEINSKHCLLFYWHNTLLGIMSSSHFIVASASLVRLERERHCISNAKDSYYGAWNENQMDVWNSGNYNCKGCSTKCPRALQQGWRNANDGHYTIKTLLLTAPLLSKSMLRREEASWTASSPLNVTF